MMLSGAIALSLLLSLQPAPNLSRAKSAFDSVPLLTSDLRPVRIGALEGIPTVVVLMESGCTNCVLSAKRAMADFPDSGLRFVLVDVQSTDSNGLKRVEAEFPQALVLREPTPRALTSLLGSRTYPEWFLLDGKGEVVDRWQGVYDPAKHKSSISQIIRK